MNIKVVSYNIDGLPEKVDLWELPLVLRPLSWVYKLFKGTTSWTYDKTSHLASCTASNLVSGDTCNVMLSNM